jgi:hypothetical protein
MGTRPVKPKCEPWCWLRKRQLRMLADVFAEGKVGNLAAARSVYLALSEIASDRENDTFTVATLYIAQRAGVTLKTVRRVVKTLKQLGFLKVQGRSSHGLKVSNQYTLVRSKGSIDPIYPSLGKTKEISLPTREECTEESREGTARKEREIVSVKDNDIVLHPRTGERFNPRTKEFVF